MAKRLPTEVRKKYIHFFVVPANPRQTDIFDDIPQI
jgi:hypothetical protein